MGLGDGLAGYWDLAEASGAGLAAFGGIDMTEVGTVGAAAGLVNATARTTSAGNYLRAPSSSDFDSVVKTTFTVAAWAYPTSFGGFDMLVAKNERFDVRQNAGNWQITNTLGGATALVPGAATGVWQFVVMWYDAAGGTLNGSLDDGATVTVSNTISGSASTRKLEFGARDGANPYTGRVGPVGLWERLLTADERTRLYNGGAGLASAVILADLDPRGVYLPPPLGGPVGRGPWGPWALWRQPPVPNTLVVPAPIPGQVHVVPPSGIPIRGVPWVGFRPGVPGSAPPWVAHPPPPPPPPSTALPGAGADKNFVPRNVTTDPRLRRHTELTATIFNSLMRRGQLVQDGAAEWRVAGAGRADGSVAPARLADETAAADSVYFSTTLGRLAYKDAAGAVHPLY